MKTRNDIHRPSVINPADYEFVSFQCRIDGIEDVYANQVNQARLQAHLAETGGRFSNHDHGGSCHVCGAHAVYLATFYHAATNSYIQTGSDCAEKMHLAIDGDFDAFKTAMRDAREAKAGKAKARAFLAEAGLEAAWDIFQQDSGFSREAHTIRDIVGKLIRYGSISDRQTAFLRTLVDQIERADEIEAQRKAEREAAEDCPEGRTEVTGQVLKAEYRDSGYGESLNARILGPVAVVCDSRDGRTTTLHSSSVPTWADLERYGLANDNPTVWVLTGAGWRDMTPAKPPGTI